jgi:lipid A 4'-phosphatase
MRNPDRAAPPFMVSWRGMGVALALTVLTALLFGLFPELDLWAAALFYLGDGRFSGVTPAGEALRRLFLYLPFVVLVGMAMLYVLRRAGLGRGTRPVWSPSGRGLAMMVLSLALGPGLLVNIGLKDHWHRPRPVQVTAFGGPDAFRPFDARDGECRRNCSFVSGEGSSSFWTVAPALLVPPPWRALVLGAALLFAAATGLLRMAFGGHFLSDTLFAALFTWLVIAATWTLIFRPRSP